MRTNMECCGWENEWKKKQYAVCSEHDYRMVRTNSAKASIALFKTAEMLGSTLKTEGLSLNIV